MFNKKLFLFGILGLFLILNISFIFAKPPVNRFPVDRYDIADGLSYSYNNEDQYHDPIRFTDDAVSEGSFIKYRVPGLGSALDTYYWEGEGSSDYIGSSYTYCWEYGGFRTSNWGENVSISCSEISGCSKTVGYQGTTSGCGPAETYDDVYSYEIDSPVGHLGVSRLEELWCANSVILGYTLSNCKSYDHYFYSLEGSNDWILPVTGNIGNCDVSQHVTSKQGYCEKYPAQDVATDDYSCDFYNGMYDDTSVFWDTTRLIPGKLEDSRKNLDSDGDGIDDGCCDTFVHNYGQFELEDLPGDMHVIVPKAKIILEVDPNGVFSCNVFTNLEEYFTGASTGPDNRVNCRDFGCTWAPIAGSGPSIS